MLLGLTIRDVVLIERLSLAFRPGLCVLTGETGAGKSILMDALALALGRRADASLVRPGAEEAAAEAARRLAEARAEEDLLRHEKAELDALAPEGDEEDQLATRRTLLQNAERIGEAVSEAAAELGGESDGEGGAQRALARALRRLERTGDRVGDARPRKGVAPPRCRDHRRIEAAAPRQGALSHGSLPARRDRLGRAWLRARAFRGRDKPGRAVWRAGEDRVGRRAVPLYARPEACPCRHVIGADADLRRGR